MKTLFEKRSVEKDGLPEKEDWYFCIREDGGHSVNFCDRLGFARDPFRQKITHYLIPVPSQGEAERAIENVINIVLNMHWDVMQNTIDAQELLTKLRDLKSTAK